MNYPFYYLEVIDQDGDWWYLPGDSITWAEIKDIQEIEMEKKIIDINLYKRGNRIESKMEPLIITKTAIKQSQHPNFDFYYLEARDQYGRWWSWRGDSSTLDEPNFEEIINIETQELRKGIINLDLYYFCDDRIVERIKRKEEVEYVFSFNMGDECGDNCIDENVGGYVQIITKNGLTYAHDKVFYDYEKLKKFALKIKEKGIVNLEFWRCFGSYDGWEGDSHLEFEERGQYVDEEPHEWDMKDLYNSLGGGEDGERIYLSDGVWLNPDGTTET